MFMSLIAQPGLGPLGPRQLRLPVSLLLLVLTLICVDQLYCVKIHFVQYPVLYHIMLCYHHYHYHQYYYYPLGFRVQGLGFRVQGGLGPLGPRQLRLPGAEVAAAALRLACRCICIYIYIYIHIYVYICINIVYYISNTLST